MAKGACATRRAAQTVTDGRGTGKARGSAFVFGISTDRAARTVGTVVAKSAKRRVGALGTVGDGC